MQRQLRTLLMATLLLAAQLGPRAMAALPPGTSFPPGMCLPAAPGGAPALPDTIYPYYTAVVHPSNVFGYRFLLEAGKPSPDRNQFISPSGLWLALAMLAEGTSGDTREAMEQALGLPDEQTLRLGLRNIAEMLAYHDASTVLAMANSIWPRKGLPVRTAYLQVLKEWYFAGSAPLDYGNDLQGSRTAINRWVSEYTKHHIPELLGPGDLDASTQLVLSNALYFKAKWVLPFDQRLTSARPFQLPGGSQVPVPMMHMPAGRHLHQYTEQPDYSALELSYGKGENVMTIILPAPGKLSVVEQGLAENLAYEVWGKLRGTAVDIWLPKFKMDLGGSVRPVLERMGLGSLFQSPDLSRMLEGTAGVAVSDVLHKAYVEVDESGTKAAAATAVPVGRSAAQSPKRFLVDRPFLFYISNLSSRAVLFLGKVVDPR